MCGIGEAPAEIHRGAIAESQKLAALACAFLPIQEHYHEVGEGQSGRTGKERFAEERRESARKPRLMSIIIVIVVFLPGVQLCGGETGAASRSRAR